MAANMKPQTYNISSNGNSSIPIGQQKQYIFTPAGFEVKLPLTVLIAMFSTVGFVGNLCVLRFIRNEEKKTARAISSKLHFFIHSLAISDVLGSLIGGPLLIVHINFDVFQSKWSCTVSRFFELVFLVITIYNLVVVALERYICICRPTSPFSIITAKKAVKAAWVLGFLAAIFCSYTFDVMRVDLNDTQYTVICMYDYTHSYGKRAVLQIFALLVYILPTICLIFTSLSVMRVVWKRKPISLPIASELSINRLLTKQRKATTLLIGIIAAFIIPYFLLIGYLLFNSIFIPSIDFKVNYALRYIAASLAYFSCFVNFVIHLVQLNGFRKYVRGCICCERHQPEIMQSIRLNVIQKPREGRFSLNSIKVDEHTKKRRSSMSNVQDTKKDKFRVRWNSF